MPRIIAVVTTVLLLASAAPGVAQTRPGAGVLDAFADVLGPIRTVRGEVVRHREATLVLRGEDGRIYTINTAGLDASAMARLKEGRPVIVAVKGGSPGAMPIASAVEAVEIDPSAAVRGRPQERVHGTVERVGLGTLTLRTAGGVVLTVDTTRTSEPVRVRPGDLVTVVGAMAEGQSERFVAEHVESDAVGPPAATPPTGR
jgi:hypothetical protein